MPVAKVVTYTLAGALVFVPAYVQVHHGGGHIDPPETTQRPVQQPVLHVASGVITNTHESESFSFEVISPRIPVAAGVVVLPRG
jgi:hypothetical protein